MVNGKGLEQKFFITYFIMGHSEKFNIFLFTGTEKECLDLVCNLNYHCAYDDIKNDLGKGYYRFQEIPEITQETAIRNKTDFVTKRLDK